MGLLPYTSLGWDYLKVFKMLFLFVTTLTQGSCLMGDDGASSFQFITGYSIPVEIIFNDMAISGLGFRGLPNLNITWYTANTKILDWI